MMTSTNRPSKEDYYLNIAHEVAMRGTCVRRNYGAVIVNNDVIVGTGYVGAPRGRVNCSDVGECYRQKHNIPRGTRYETCLSKNTRILTNGTIKTIEEMYLSTNSDMDCVAAIEASGRELLTPDNVLYRNPGLDFVPELKVNAPIGNIMKTKFCETLLRVPIISLIRYKDDEAIKALETGHIDCTPEHKFLTPSGYVVAEDLSAGDMLTQCVVAQNPYEIPYNDYVYDIEVPEYENFGILYSETCYTFSHNCRSVHAECNAIMNAGRDRCIGATLYLCGVEATTGELIKNADCCNMCKRMVINSGIDKVVIRDPDKPENMRIVSVSDWVKDDDFYEENNSGY